jgi:hypothetical protein
MPAVDLLPPGHGFAKAKELGVYPHGVVTFMLYPVGNVNEKLAARGARG